jgi:PAS domain S-box-containing protein
MENERYRTILHSIGDGVIVTNEKGEIEEMNRVAEILTGWKGNAALKRPVADVLQIINEKNRKKTKNPVSHVLREGSMVNLSTDTMLISKEGNEIPVIVSSAPVYHKNGKITGTVLVFRDQIVEREQQRKIEESEALYRGLFSATREGICIHQLVFDLNNQPADYIILDLNHKYEQITGLTRQQVIGKKATEAYSTDSPPYLEIYSKVALSEEPCSFETYFPPMKKHFQISVFSPKKELFATVFTEINKQNGI